MEVVVNKHSKKHPIELNYQDIDKTVSLVLTLDNAKKLLSDLDAAIKEIEKNTDMTNEEKQLLLNDLCGRLPYEVKVDHFGVLKELLGIIPPCFPDANIMVGYDINDYEDTIIEDIKPYLRPMSSMTEEEKKEYESIFSIGEYSSGGSLYGEEYEYINDSYNDVTQSVFLIDWLLSHHFDFRGLIKMGLALEAPEGMYKTE